VRESSVQPDKIIMGARERVSAYGDQDLCSSRSIQSALRPAQGSQRGERRGLRARGKGSGQNHPEIEPNRFSANVALSREDPSGIMASFASELRYGPYVGSTWVFCRRCETSSDENRPMRSSSRIEGDLQIRVRIVAHPDRTPTFEFCPCRRSLAQNSIPAQTAR
jgi:hypothetical protein